MIWLARLMLAPNASEGASAELGDKSGDLFPLVVEQPELGKGVCEFERLLFEDVDGVKAGER